MITSLLALLFTSSNARAEEPAPSADEVEESGDGDAFATASQALGKAEQALDVAQSVKSRVVAVEGVQAGHTTRITELERKLKELKDRGVSSTHPDYTAIKDELAAAVKANADRAESAATRAEAAKLAAEQAATRAAASAVQASTSATQSATSAATGGNTSPGDDNSMNSQEFVDRDAGEHKPTAYGIVGVGSSAFGREASYGETAGVRVLQTPELTSWMVGGFGEAGVRDFGPGGRLHAGAELFVDYNVGGGTHIGGGPTFGAFVEKTHTVRFAVTLGGDWELIPNDVAGVSAYQNFRYFAALNADVVLAENWVLRLTGRGMIDNRVPITSGSSAGQAGVGIAYAF